jgi:hypothetical protein
MYTQREEYVESLPETVRATYRMAFGGSKAKAVKAKCLECSCNQREEIRNCPIIKCPLWEVRPFRESKDERPNIFSRS